MRNWNDELRPAFEGRAAVPAITKNGDSQNNRWTHWASEINTRYTCSSRRNFPATMIFVRHAFPVCVYSNAWHKMAASLYSRIWISINFIKREIVSAERAISGILSGQDLNHRNFLKSDSQVSKELFPGSAMVLVRNSRGTLPQDAPPRNGILQKDDAAFSALSVSIVDRVFLRFQRSEMLTGQTMVRQKNRTDADVTAKAKMQQLAELNQPGELQREQMSRFVNQFSQPVVDIGRLTDEVVRHIDHRITAHRERMGKVF